MSMTVLSDQQALDRIATLLGTQSSWPGADCLEDIANLVGRTERPHPGDRAATYRADFKQATGRDVVEAFVGDEGEPQ